MLLSPLTRHYHLETQFVLLYQISNLNFCNLKQYLKMNDWGLCLMFRYCNYIALEQQSGRYSLTNLPQHARHAKTFFLRRQRRLRLTCFCFTPSVDVYGHLLTLVPLNTVDCDKNQRLTITVNFQKNDSPLNKTVKFMNKI